MKKLLALTLAVAMVLSMASVAFAAKEALLISVDTDPYWEANDEDWEDDGSDYPYLYFGEKVYYYLCYESENDVGPIVDTDMADRIKLKYDFTSGEQYVKSVDLVKKNAGGIGIYFLEIALNEAPTVTGTKDIIGEVEFSGSKLYFSNGIPMMEAPSFEEWLKEMEFPDEYKLQVALTARNRPADGNNRPTFEETGDDYYVYKFSEDMQDEEHEIELFGDMGRFVVNTLGQGKLVVKTNVEYNKGIENADPDVNYVYFNSNNAAFNKIGNLYLNAEKDNILYKVESDGSLTKLDAPYDEDEEAFVVRTRVIGNYVIAESELTEEALTAGVEKEEAPEVMVPSNPSTGAAC